MIQSDLLRVVAPAKNSSARRGRCDRDCVHHVSDTTRYIDALQVRVSHRCFDVGVPQYMLHFVDRHSVLNEPRCVCVPQRMDRTVG